MNSIVKLVYRWNRGSLATPSFTCSPFVVVSDEITPSFTCSPFVVVSDEV